MNSQRAMPVGRYRSRGRQQARPQAFQPQARDRRHSRFARESPTPLAISDHCSARAECSEKLTRRTSSVLIRHVSERVVDADNENEAERG